MDSSNTPLFDAALPEAPTDLAAALARPALPGHFDELRGLPGSTRPAGTENASENIATPPGMTPAWGQFFDILGHEGLLDLNRRTSQLERQIRDNGVTYNVYADAGGLQRLLIVGAGRRQGRHREGRAAVHSALIVDVQEVGGVAIMIVDLPDPFQRSGSRAYSPIAATARGVRRKAGTSVGSVEAATTPTTR